MQSLSLFGPRAKSNAKPTIMKMVAVWAFRIRSRRTLADLPDYILNDIGLSKAEAKKEAQRPFWQ